MWVGRERTYLLIGREGFLGYINTHGFIIFLIRIYSFDLAIQAFDVAFALQVSFLTQVANKEDGIPLPTAQLINTGISPSPHI
jgi:hypothetical protein